MSMARTPVPLDLVTEKGRLDRAVAELPRSKPQMQLLLLRNNLGPRANYYLRALPLVQWRSWPPRWT